MPTPSFANLLLLDRCNVYKPHLTKYKHVRFHIVDMPGYVVIQTVWVNQKGIIALHGAPSSPESFPSKPLVIPVKEAANKENIIQAFLKAMSVLNNDIEKALANKEQTMTPAAKWRIEGQPDPHPHLLDKEREDLVMGDMTDDELANAVFMHGNTPMTPAIAQLIIEGKAHSSHVYLTAAKDRIRWLSRKLVQAEEELAKLKGRLNLCEDEGCPHYGTIHVCNPGG